MTKVIPAGTWAVFSVPGRLAESASGYQYEDLERVAAVLQSYKLAGNYNIELYAPPCETPGENYAEIWVPVVKA